MPQKYSSTEVAATTHDALPRSELDLEARAIPELEAQRLADLISSNLSRRITRFDVPPLSPLGDAHKSEYDTTVNVARRQSYFDYSPYSSSPSTAVNSRAPSPTKDLDDDDERDTVVHEDKLSWRLASGFFALFLGGWADGVTGTVMPSLSSEFGLTSTLSSSLFAASTCGYFAGTFLVEFVMQNLGRFRVKRNHKSIFALLPAFRGKGAFDDDFGHSDSQARFLTLVIASVIHAMYFIMMGSRSGFPVMFLAYIFSAFSRALLTAPLNAFFAAGPKQSLGYALGFASFGSVASPLVCQSIIATGVPWYRFYYGSLVLSGVNIFVLAMAFKPTSGETFRDRQRALAAARLRKSRFLRSGRSSPVDGVDVDMSRSASTLNVDFEEKARSALRRALSMPYQWAFSFFILLYCGSETVTQGFMVTFLLKTRHANPKTVGYVTSGFWGGISIGRFLWGYCIPKMTFTQRKHTVHACIGSAVGLHLLIWFVKSTIADAVSASIIGVLYGPIFPACLSMANDILPEEVHMVAMALISAFASLGGAIFPLMTGAILDAKGIHTLTYVTVPLAAAMACLWALFPSRWPSRPLLT